MLIFMDIFSFNILVFPGLWDAEVTKWDQVRLKEVLSLTSKLSYYNEMYYCGIIP